MVELVKIKVIHTLKTEIYHLAAALSAALFIYLFLGDLRFSILAFAVSFFVDIDHTLDYFLAEGFKIDLKSFFSGEFFEKWKRVMIIFHGWEYVLFFLAFFVFTRNPIFLTLATALLFHYIVDLFTNTCMHKLGYFFFFRLLHRFRFKEIIVK